MKEPHIIEKPNAVVVTIRHEPLASPEQKTLEYLEANPSIQNKDARGLCHISEDWIVRGIFKRLEARGLIAQVKDTRTASTAYEPGHKFSGWRSRLDGEPQNRRTDERRK